MPDPSSPGRPAPPGARRPKPWPTNGAEQACQATDLVALVSETVQLRRVGQQWRGLCPFHPDRDPSLSVEPAKGVYLCHGCGATGNAITWVARVHGMIDGDAVHWLLQRAGIPDPRDQLAARREAPRASQRVVAAYDYVGADGNLLYQVVRFEPKTFRQRRTDGQGGWAWGLGDVHRVLYRLPEVLRAGRAGETIWVVEGEKDADALAAAGVVATTAAQGAKSPWLEDYTQSLAGAGEVVVVADNDPPGLARARVVRDALRSARIPTRVVRAAAGKDASDHLAAGHALDEFVPVADDELGPATATAAAEDGKVRPLRTGDHEARARVGDYYATPEGLWRLVADRDGERLVRLTTADMELVRSVVRDWGDEQTVAHKVAVRRGDQEVVVEVDAETISRPGLILGRTNLGATVLPGQGQHATAAMHLLSTRLERATVYPHLGWREIDRCWLFLHGEGAIGPAGPVDGVHVEAVRGYGLPVALAGPDLAAGVAAALQALAAHEPTMAVLLGAVWRAVLPVLPPASIHLSGRSGIGKTSLVKLALSFFGPRAAPMAWLSTANSVEEMAWAAAGHVLALDDFVARDEHQRSQLEATAERILRNAANHLGRSRMRPDGTLRPDRPPRALIVSTGEEVPGAGSQSQRARVLVVELETTGAPVGQQADPARTAALTAAQRAAADGLLAGLTAAYVQWLAGRVAEQGIDAARRALEGAEAEAARRWAAVTSHARTAPAVASLAIGWDLWLGWAEDVVGLDAAAARRARSAVDACLDDLARAQVRFLAEADPVDIWIGHLVAALRAGRCHVTPRDDGAAVLDDAWGWQDGEGKGEHVGWVDHEAVYLVPDATHAVVARLARDMGQSWPWSPRSTWQRLLERGCLVRGDARHPFTPRISVAGRREYVLHVPRAVVLDDATRPEADEQEL
jgi:hypothetical protein